MILHQSFIDCFNLTNYHSLIGILIELVYLVRYSDYSMAVVINQVNTKKPSLSNKGMVKVRAKLK